MRDSTTARERISFVTTGGQPPLLDRDRQSRSDNDGPFTVLEDVEYLAIRRLLSESAGMLYDEKRREVLRLHLRDRAIATGCDSFKAYVELVSSSRNELQALWNQVAIHQTEFFRNRPQFEALRERVLPEIVRHADSRKTLTLWSAGCSSGEEPYSLGIVLLDTLGDRAREWQIRIVATDISTEILARAKNGVYESRRLQGLPNSVRNRWFMSLGDSYAIRPEVKDLVDFSAHNLPSDQPPIAGEADVIFCRNVTIYFSRDALIRTIETLETALRPGGYLFLGHSESLWRQPHNLELIDLGDSFAYRMPHEDPKSPVLKAASGRTFGPSVMIDLASRSEEKVGNMDSSLKERPVHESSESSHMPGATFVESTDPFSVLRGDNFESADSEIAALKESNSPLLHAEVSEVIATAQGHLERGQVEEVVRLIAVALERAPTEAALHFLLGTAEQRLGHESAALTSFGRAVYCDPAFSLAYLYRGMLLEERGECSQALLEYRNALSRLQSDHLGKWDAYLESMNHEALVHLCADKINALEGGDQ